MAHNIVVLTGAGKLLHIHGPAGKEVAPFFQQLLEQGFHQPKNQNI
ncbi:hypothetical protein [Bacterioplanoides pacificum]|uniref:Uncharacterized protein n=1 Tax=Bacterioplanoides pacificum TaxID=1171596 RepID=A0ABV7VUE9_9GAMM